MRPTDQSITIDTEKSSISCCGKERITGLSFSLITNDRTVTENGDNVVIRESCETSGKDSFGKFTGTKKTIVREYIDSKDRHWDMDSARLELTSYGDFFTSRCFADTDSSLHPEGHFRIQIGNLDGIKDLLSLNMYCDWWTRPHFDTNLGKIPRSNIVLWQTADGTYGCLLPLIDNGAKTYFIGRGKELCAEVYLYDSGHRSRDCLSFIGAFGDNPYKLIEHCVEKGMELTGHPGRMRKEKPYPEVFDYFGWCTWDALYDKVNEMDILAKVHQFVDNDFPVHWVLIDDGWSVEKRRQLFSFDADDQKFEYGLAWLADQLKNVYGVSHVGVWHTFIGYWRGINEESEIYNDYRDNILTTKRDSRIPHPTVDKGFGFWNAWHQSLRSKGIDFIKVDNQGCLYQYTNGVMPIGEAARGMQHALQASAGLHFSGNMINCMCMHTENMWHLASSNISRNSDDFFPKKPESVCEHTRQNVYNNLLYANFSWPDWDMWWSDHESAKAHAALRAISGGPVYVSDRIDCGNLDILRPLMLSDGKLLRALEPAMPTPDCIFLNPEKKASALKIFNRTENGYAICAVNATSIEKPVKGAVSPSDIPGIEGDYFACYEYFTGETRVIKKDQSIRLEVPGNEARLFTIVPLLDNCAVIGLSDKYLSNAAVQSLDVSQKSISICLHEGGELLVYSKSKPKKVVADGKEQSFEYNKGWLKVDLPAKKALQVCVLQ